MNRAILKPVLSSSINYLRYCQRGWLISPLLPQSASRQYCTICCPCRSIVISSILGLDYVLCSLLFQSLGVLLCSFFGVLLGALFRVRSRAIVFLPWLIGVIVRQFLWGLSIDVNSLHKLQLYIGCKLYVWFRRFNNVLAQVLLPRNRKQEIDPYTTAVIIQNASDRVGMEIS